MIFLLFLLLLFPHTAWAKEMPIELKTPSNIDLSIMGEPLATQEQCVAYLRKRGRIPLLTVSVEQLVSFFYQESKLEGIRPDVAFAQAIHETGHFRYGGDVIPLQNNYSGLGTTGGGVKGAWFPTAQIGVRAQVQHLLAYTSTKPPELEIVDPRYELVKRTAKFGQARTWTDLNGKWAVPGKTYGQMILRIHQKILSGD
ncbi:glucosaminidase domain-containing protein [Sporomusa sp.]|uniref:glucosaminidase domain-containing protein n=1 Tax=Sporomusa sp. TaxID=2078658 RepID=UPI002B8F9B8E|nr:glucosaminidase domain-containing protein [Sporomusa sp.]HWR42721.1 glucosaminidase domain-containing protein [Sporomusa sp.]